VGGRAGWPASKGPLTLAALPRLRRGGRRGGRRRRVGRVTRASFSAFDTPPPLDQPVGPFLAPLFRQVLGRLGTELGTDLGTTEHRHWQRWRRCEGLRLHARRPVVCDCSGERGRAMLLAKLDHTLRSRKPLRPGTALPHRRRRGIHRSCRSAARRACALRQPLSIGVRQWCSLLLERRPGRALCALVGAWLLVGVIGVNDGSERPEALHLNPIHAFRRRGGLLVVPHRLFGIVAGHGAGLSDGYLAHIACVPCMRIKISLLLALKLQAKNMRIERGTLPRSPDDETGSSRPDPKSEHCASVPLASRFRDTLCKG